MQNLEFDQRLIGTYLIIIILLLHLLPLHLLFLLLPQYPSSFSSFPLLLLLLLIPIHDDSNPKREQRYQADEESRIIR